MNLGSAHLPDPERARLVEGHLSWAVWVARKIVSRPDEDVIQAARLGLCEAAARFDPSLGFTFRTASMPWITKEVILALRNRRSTYLPKKHRLEDYPERVESILTRDGRERTDYLSHAPSSNGQSSTLRREIVDLVRRILSPYEYEVIVRRFGIGDPGQTRSTLEKIGADYGYSRERIRQIEDRALGVLRVELSRRGRPLSTSLGVVRRAGGPIRRGRAVA